MSEQPSLFPEERPDTPLVVDPILTPMETALRAAGFSVANDQCEPIMWMNPAYAWHVVYLFNDGRWEHHDPGDLRDDDGDGITHRGVGLGSLESMLRDLAEYAVVAGGRTDGI